MRIVHCHRLSLGHAGPADFALLDDAERERASRFRFDRLRTWHVAAHAGMRRLLGGWLDVDPATIAFATTANGKPVLAAGAAAGPRARSASPHFNLTHCEALGYLAIADFEVGIDVEAVRPLADLDALVESCCSRDEGDRIARLPAGTRGAAFLRLWTRKEAALKAWGTGIGAVPLADVAADAEVLEARLSPDGAMLPPLRLHTVARDGHVLSVAAVTPEPFVLRFGADPEFEASPD